jgi:hypothetical protein
MTDESGDDLVTLLSAETAFEAHTIVAVLKNAGIDAVAFDATRTGMGLSIKSVDGVPVQVRRVDFERARGALETNISDSVDIDWDEVDVGEREDDAPLRAPGRMPVLAQVAFGVAVLVFIAGLATAIAMLLDW